MASKPVSLPRWGEDVAGVVGPNEVEPLATKKDVGWTPGEEPPAEYWNWYKRLVYKWVAYLKDGIFAADAGSGADGANATGDGVGAGVNAFGGATGPGVQATPGGGTAAPVRGSVALVPLAADPTTPADGDLWTKTTGLFARIGGALWTFAALAVVQTWTAKQTFNGGAASTTPADGDNTTNVATTAFVKKRINAPAVNPAVSTASGTFSTAATTPQDVTNLTVSLSTNGRPVVLMLQTDGVGNSGFDVGAGGTGFMQWVRDGVALGPMQWFAGTQSLGVPPGAANMIDTGATAGVRTYKLQVWSNNAAQSVLVRACKIVVFEL